VEEITYENTIVRLLGAVPEFHPDEEDVRDHLVHLVFEDLTRFVKSALEADNKDQLLKRVFGLIEEAASSHDVRLLDAIRDSFLEGLADSRDHLAKAHKYMGSSTLKLLGEARAYLNP
jgi:class 3 adenylate cyclase